MSPARPWLVRTGLRCENGCCGISSSIAQPIGSPIIPCRGVQDAGGALRGLHDHTHLPARDPRRRRPHPPLPATAPGDPAPIDARHSRQHLVGSSHPIPDPSEHSRSPCDRRICRSAHPHTTPAEGLLCCGESHTIGLHPRRKYTSPRFRWHSGRRSRRTDQRAALQ